MAFRSVRPLPRPLRALAAALVLAVWRRFRARRAPTARAPAGRARTTPRRPIGQRAEGVLRFPQALAVGPDGSVYVADQGSHVVQVFGPDGVFRREVGIAGTRPGQLSAVGAIAVAGDGSLLVADGSNRIDRFDAEREPRRLLGRGRAAASASSASARAAATPRRRAAAWPSRATSSTSPTPATTACSASPSTAATAP